MAGRLDDTADSMSAFKPIAAIGPLPIWAGVAARVVEGREMSFAIVELAADAVVAEHQHPNEQIGVVLSGSLTFRIGSESQRLVVGDTYVIPADVPHQATAGSEGCVVVDVFAPVRADWARFQPEAPRSPQWP